jgi:hypothetical protein
VTRRPGEFGKRRWSPQLPIAAFNGLQAALTLDCAGLTGGFDVEFGIRSNLRFELAAKFSSSDAIRKRAATSAEKLKEKGF